MLATVKHVCVKLHENLQLITSKLLTMKMINTSNIEQLADLCACDASKTCMYGECVFCQNKTVDFLREFDDNELVECFQWISCSEQKINKKGQNITIKITIKEELTLKASKLVDDYGKLIKLFKSHIFNIRHQYQMYRYLKSHLSENECMIHIDFAENYSCKYFKEIQSVHFGGSHAQATLHNELLYINRNNNVETVSFCTISDSLEHNLPVI